MESQRFELWEAINLICFQDKHHKPLGQLSKEVLNELQNQVVLPYADALLLERQGLHS